MAYRLTGEDRIKADRMWRDQKAHAAFQAETGYEREDRDYAEAFNEWAEENLDFHDEED